MSVDILERFKRNYINFDSFMRIDTSHILDLYLGRDTLNRYALLLVSKEKPINIRSSVIVNIEIGRRQDGLWAISFSLTSSDYIDIFCQFCNDIIESSRVISKKEFGTKFICNRYLKWQNMLKLKSTNILSYQEIKGLIGEIYFLKNYLFEKIGVQNSIYSWIGPKKADQDFIYKNTWFEIKSTVTGSDSVKISSIQQLDTINDGKLIIVYLDKTSYEDTNKITLNGLVNELFVLIKDESLISYLNDLLFEQGYINRIEYDEYCFKFNGFESYIVDKDFPCLRKNSLPNSIKNVNYDLLLGAIKDYKGE